MLCDKGVKTSVNIRNLWRLRNNEILKFRWTIKFLEQVPDLFIDFLFINIIFTAFLYSVNYSEFFENFRFVGHLDKHEINP